LARLAEALAIEGHCDPAFAAVREAFADNFEAGGELGAAVAVVVDGKRVVDLWGGLADATREAPWQQDTLCTLFSSTKAATAFAIHYIAAEGRLNLDRPVADYWPAFAQAGKETVTLRMVLDHSAGVPAIRQPLPADCLTRHDLMAEAIAAEEPFWEPGTRVGYHATTFGFILAEVVRQVTGESLGSYVRNRIAGPLGLDFWIGLPESEESRVARIEPFLPSPEMAETPFVTAAKTRGSVTNLFVFNSGDWMVRGVNSRAGRAAEIGAANGLATARDLAGLYHGVCLGGQGRSALLPRDTVQGFARVSTATHRDETLRLPTRFGPGFMVTMDNRGRGAGYDNLLLSDTAFGHSGAGGSLGFADPACGLAFGYVMNRMGEGLLLNSRGQALVDAVYGCLGYRSAAGAWITPGACS